MQLAKGISSVSRILRRYHACLLDLAAAVVGTAGGEAWLFSVHEVEILF